MNKNVKGEAFARLLCEARNENGQTQQNVVDGLVAMGHKLKNNNCGLICNWETGMTLPSRGYIRHLSTIYGVPLDELLHAYVIDRTLVALKRAQAYVEPLRKKAAE